MTQYNRLNVKLSNSQLNKLKLAIKDETELILKTVIKHDKQFWWWNIFPHELLLTNRQVTNLRKSFSNDLWANIKLSNTQLSKMVQSREFLSKSLGPLLKTG